MSHILFYPVGSNEELLEGGDSAGSGNSTAPGKTMSAPVITPKTTEIGDDDDQDIKIKKQKETEEKGTIRYTTDGTIPDRESTEYTEPLSAAQLLEDSNDEEVTIAAVVEDEGKMSEVAIGKVKKIKVTP